MARCADNCRTKSERTPLGDRSVELRSLPSRQRFGAVCSVLPSLPTVPPRDEVVAVLADLIGLDHGRRPHAGDNPTRAPAERRGRLPLRTGGGGVLRRRGCSATSVHRAGSVQQFGFLSLNEPRRSTALAGQDGHAVGREIATTSLGEGLDRELVAETLDEYDRRRGPLVHGPDTVSEPSHPPPSVRPGSRPPRAERPR